MNELTTSNLACALNIVEFDEPAHIVVVGERDIPKFKNHEEAFLRELGVIPDGQTVNGFIEEPSDSSAPPSGIPGEACIYQHVQSGGCRCTYKKKCFKITIPLPPGPGIPTISTCGGGDSFAIRADLSAEVLIGPKALRTMILDPERFCKVVDLDGRPIQGIIPLIDLDLLDMNTWHLQVWAHISEGACKCNWLPIESKKVELSNFRLGH